MDRRINFDSYYDPPEFDETCEVCREHVDDCECPECPICGEHGSKHCPVNGGKECDFEPMDRRKKSEFGLNGRRVSDKWLSFWFFFGLTVALGFFIVR